MAITNYAAKVDHLFGELLLLENKIASERCITNPKFANQVCRLKNECHHLHRDAFQLDDLIRNSRFRSTFNNEEHEIEKRTYLLKNEMGFLKDRLNDYLTLEYNPPQCSSIFSSPSTGSSPGHPSTWNAKLPKHIIQHSQNSQNSQNSYTSSDYSNQHSQSSSSSQPRHPLSRPTLPVFGPGFGFNNSQPQLAQPQFGFPGFVRNPAPNQSGGYFNNVGAGVPGGTRMFQANANSWLYGAAGSSMY